MSLFKKMPAVEQLAPVYAVITSVVYIWALIQFFWRIPSWLYFSSANEILVFYAYVATVNLIESLIIFAFVVIMLLLLPASWTEDQWIVKSVLFAAIGLGFLAYKDYTAYPEKVFYELPFNQLMSILAAEALILITPFKRVPVFCKIVENLADRFIIFLYIIAPVSALSLVVVIYCNLF